MAQAKDPNVPKFVVDRASGKIISAGPEEIDATQPLLDMLINELGWDPGQLVSRPNQWRVPASPSNKRAWPVDVAAFDGADHLREAEHVKVFFECKRPDVLTGVEQLKIYMDREPHVKVGVWFNGVDHRIVLKVAGGYELAPVGTPIPRPGDPLIPIGNKAVHLTDLRTVKSLRPVFDRIRNRIAGQDTHVNRDEEMLPDLANLVLLKVQDELDHKLRPQDAMGFQLLDTPTKTANHLRAMLKAAIDNHPDTFVGTDARFAIDDDSVAYVVGELKDIKILGNGEEMVREAFEVLRGKAFKGEEGQFFTKFNAVEMMIAALDVQPTDRFIDPACGSGSFGVEALDEAVRKLRTNTTLTDADVQLAADGFVREHLRMLDKDAVSVRLARAHLGLLAGGATANVMRVNSLRPSTWPQRVQQLCALGSFDKIATNPPFGTKVRSDGEIGKAEKYELAQEWKRNKETGRWEATGEYVARDIGLLFVELCMRLLKGGGSLAIVLPDTYLFSPTYGWFQQWLRQFTITHLLGIPIELFEPHCRAKTTAVVIQKQAPRPKHQIICADGRTFGADKHGKRRYKFDGETRTQLIDDDLHETTTLLNMRPKAESRLWFRVPQDDVSKASVYVAQYHWRKPTMEALGRFADENNCDLVSVGELEDSKNLTVMAGHGSPSSHYKGRGSVAYVKVSDIKNWRVNENPANALPTDIADNERRGRYLQPFDLVTPTRACKNIGLFGVVMPWQTDVILTREINVWRTGDGAGVDWALMLALCSLKVVFAQFQHLVLMQMNREDLSDRYRELLLPVPRSELKRHEWADPIREFFEAQIKARTSYERMGEVFTPEMLADRP
ncbi:MAG: N-6 DNA methylase [Actinomycetota bacterium]|nr:N-6 DNA methylase [Actinomycetota bacterium]